MCESAVRACVCVPLFWAALSSLAVAAYTPPPKLDDLVRADFAAVGHFVERDEGVRFVAERALWGDAGVVEKLLDDDDFPVRAEESGGLTAWTWGSASGVTAGDGSGAEDAKQRAIWFFFRDAGSLSLAAGSEELAEGFLALRRAERPSALFRLVQRLDFDMRREAMEEPAARRDEKVLAALHRVALTRDSLAVYNAVDLLQETRLLDAFHFWGRWTDHPAVAELQVVLQQLDADRVARELRNAVEAETQPARVAQLLYQAREDDDLNIDHLDDAAEEVRERALSNLYSRLWQLARQPGRSSQAEALARRLLPLLEARREIETSGQPRRTLDKMLEEQAGIPWILRLPTTEEPPPPYSEAEERKFVVGRLTSWQHGFAMESAGREIKEHFFAEGFEKLKEAAASRNYNTKSVYDGMGYVRHPSVFAHLVERAKTMSVGDDAFRAVLRAIGRQNHQRSFDVLKELLESRLQSPGAFALQGAFDALGLVRDKRAFDLLRDLRGAAIGGSAMHYVRARAALGDPWAINELLAALHEPSLCQLLRASDWDRDSAVGALLLADTPEATEAIKQHVQDAWPTRWESFDEPDLWWCMGMQNYAGDSRRTTSLGEVARRDPSWLAELALRKMESSSLSARICGAYVFRGLTTRSFDFRPEAFASERTAPLKTLQGWWARHGTETRERWLLSYFRERGFRMTRLHDRSSLPVLVRALTAESTRFGCGHSAVAAPRSGCRLPIDNTGVQK